MNNLPAELVPLIIQHVDEKKSLLSCSLVNHCFYTATIPFLWCSLTAGRNNNNHGNGASKLIDCLMEAHHPMATYLRRLEIYSSWTDTEFMLLLPNVRLLEDLEIHDGANLTDTSFQLLPQHCPRLRTLKASYLAITQLSMNAIGQHCHQLRKLSLRLCPQLSHRTCFPLRACPLEELWIVSGVYASIWAHLTIADLAELERLTHSEFIEGSSSTSQQLLSSTDAWTHLTHLVLDDLDDVGDDTLIPFIQSHPRIRHLTLQRSLLTDATLDAMSTYLPGLMHVGLEYNDHFSVGALRRLVCRCPHLAFVDLFRCFLSNAAFPEATPNCLVYNEDGGYYILKWLNQETIQKIRQVGPEGNGNNDATDDDGDDNDDHRARLLLWQSSFRYRTG